MIDWAIDNLLGSWGRPAVNFYFDFALPINLIVVAYGIALAVWHIRLRPYRRAALVEAARIVGKLDSRKKSAGAAARSSAVQSALKAQLNWSTIAQEGGEGALVAGRWGLRPHRATAESLSRLIPYDELARDTLAARASS